MTTTKVSARREILTYNGEDGATGYVGVFVDDIQIAAGVRQDEGYAGRNNGAQWALWSPLLTLRLDASEEASGTAFGHSASAAHPLPVRTEADVRAWLSLLGDLAENGPKR